MNSLGTDVAQFRIDSLSEKNSPFKEKKEDMSTESGGRKNKEENDSGGDHLSLSTSSSLSDPDLLPTPLYPPFHLYAQRQGKKKWWKKKKEKKWVAIWCAVATVVVMTVLVVRLWAAFHKQEGKDDNPLPSQKIVPSTPTRHDVNDQSITLSLCQQGKKCAHLKKADIFFIRWELYNLGRRAVLSAQQQRLKEGEKTPATDELLKSLAQEEVRLAKMWKGVVREGRLGEWQQRLGPTQQPQPQEEQQQPSSPPFALSSPPSSDKDDDDDDDAGNKSENDLMALQPLLPPRKITAEETGPMTKEKKEMALLSMKALSSALRQKKLMKKHVAVVASLPAATLSILRRGAQAYPPPSPSGHFYSPSSSFSSSTTVDGTSNSHHREKRGILGGSGGNGFGETKEEVRRKRETGFRRTHITFHRKIGLRQV